MIETAEMNNMSDMEQFQIVVSEIQSIRQQMASLNAQILDLKATSEAVSNQPKELALHQQLGGVLIEVADREALVKVLESDINTLSEHLTRLQSREGDLIDDALIEKIENEQVTFRVGTTTIIKNVGI